MSLVRFSRSYPSLFDRFFDNDFFNWSNQHQSPINATLPSVNIKEGDKSFEVQMAAPGLKKEDFKIEINHNLLTFHPKTRLKKKRKRKMSATLAESSAINLSVVHSPYLTVLTVKNFSKI